MARITLGEILRGKPFLNSEVATACCLLFAKELDANPDKVAECSLLISLESERIGADLGEVAFSILHAMQSDRITPSVH